MDSTPAVVAGLAESDPRIRLLSRPHAGVSAARNAGLAEVRGAFVAVSRQRQPWVPHFLQTLLGAVVTNSLEVAFSAIEAKDGPAPWFRGFPGDLEDLKFANHIDLNALVVEAGLLRKVGGFDPSLRRTVDWELALRLAAVASPQLVNFVGVRYDDSRAQPDRISVAEPAAWADVVRSRWLIDWAALEGRERTPGSVTIVVQTLDRWDGAERCVASLLHFAEGHDVEVVVVDQASQWGPFSVLAAVFADDPRVTLVRNPRDQHTALGGNLGAAAGSGELLVFVSEDVEVEDAWVPALTDALAAGAATAQPLLVHRNGSVRSAGWELVDGSPSSLWADHPSEDALTRSTWPAAAAAGEFLAVRAEDFIGVQGFDPLFGDHWYDLDLGLRLAGSTGGSACSTEVAAVVHDAAPPQRRVQSAPFTEEFQRRWGRLGSTARPDRRGSAGGRWFAGQGSGSPLGDQDREPPRTARPGMGRPPFRPGARRGTAGAWAGGGDRPCGSAPPSTYGHGR